MKTISIDTSARRPKLHHLNLGTEAQCGLRAISRVSFCIYIIQIYTVSRVNSNEMLFQNFENEDSSWAPNQDFILFFKGMRASFCCHFYLYMGLKRRWPHLVHLRSRLPCGHQHRWAGQGSSKLAIPLPCLRRRPHQQLDPSKACVCVAQWISGEQLVHIENFDDTVSEGGDGPWHKWALLLLHPAMRELFPRVMHWQSGWKKFAVN